MTLAIVGQRPPCDARDREVAAGATAAAIVLRCREVTAQSAVLLQDRFRSKWLRNPSALTTSVPSVTIAKRLFDGPASPDHELYINSSTDPARLEWATCRLKCNDASVTRLIEYGLRQDPTITEITVENGEIKWVQQVLTEARANLLRMMLPPDQAMPVRPAAFAPAYLSRAA